MFAACCLICVLLTVLLPGSQALFILLAVLLAIGIVWAAVRERKLKKGGAAKMLKLTGISKTFNPGTANEKTALNRLSLDVAGGDFITIIGSNGAGKSTLFNAICGGFYVDEGKVELDGEDVTFLPEHRRALVHRPPVSGSHAGHRAKYDH